MKYFDINPRKMWFSSLSTGLFPLPKLANLALSRCKEIHSLSEKFKNTNEELDKKVRLFYCM